MELTITGILLSPAIHVQVSLGRVIAKNAPEWWVITLGLLAAFISGILFPAYAIFFGEVLEVLIVPAGEVLRSIHVWAALFVAIAIASGLSNFFKVNALMIPESALHSNLMIVMMCIFRFWHSTFLVRT